MIKEIRGKNRFDGDEIITLQNDLTQVINAMIAEFPSHLSTQNSSPITKQTTKNNLSL